MTDTEKESRAEWELVWGEYMRALEAGEIEEES